MVRLKCEICNSNNFLKKDGLFVCQNCGCKYTDKDAKGLIEQRANSTAQVAINKKIKLFTISIIAAILLVVLLSIILFVLSADNPDKNQIQPSLPPEEVTESDNSPLATEPLEVEGTAPSVVQPEVNCDITEIRVGIKSGGKDDVTVLVGDSFQLKAYVTPSDATDNLTWTSADSSIVTVDENGMMKIHKQGQTTITATAPNGVSGKLIIRARDGSSNNTDFVNES